MSKLSQCNKCVIGTGILCEYYQSYSSNECPHFYEKVDSEINVKLIMQLCLLGGTLVSGFWGGRRFLLIYIALVALVVCSIYGIIEHYKSHKYKYFEMRNLVLGILKQIGCQPEIDKENESHVNFLYQGENFFISIENECLITFYETWWGSLDLNNPNIENLKEAINLTNIGNIPKVLYTIDTEGQKLGIHSMYRVFLKKGMPALPDMFKAILNDFFQTQKEVKGRFAALNDEKKERNRKERVKVKGFVSL